jgi:hypothetical protein
VLLRDDGRVVLTDFGIATFTGDSSITSTGLLLGSPSYIAPERARGEVPGPPSDLWSLGATLFTAVEGRPPYDKGQPLPTLTEVVTGEHAPFVAAGPLAPVLDGLLETDPTRRYDAATACAELKRVMEEVPDTAEIAARPAEAATTRRTNRTTAVSLGDVAEEVRQEEQAPFTPYPGEPTAQHTFAPPRVLPTGPAGRRGRTGVVLGVLALVLAVGIGLLLSPAFRDGAGDLASPGGTSQDSGAEGEATAKVPTGWVTHSESGWTVAVPPSYTPGSFNGGPQYKDQKTGRTLRVSTTAAGGGKSDAVADRRTQAAAFAAKHQNYRQIAIGTADYRGLEAADWEFTYTDGGADLHALSRVFVVDGKGYSLFFQTRSTDDWSAAKADFDKIAAAFQP